MNRRTFFSKHAIKRVSERTNVDCQLIADMLDYNGAIEIGELPVFNKKHHLFYSAADNACFVAIQDGFTGEVITILTIEYHENLAWKIAPDLIDKAKLQSLSYFIPEPTIEITQPLNLFVRMRYVAPNSHLKTKSLFSQKVTSDISKPCELANSSTFESEVNRSCLEKGVDPSWVIEVTVSLGRKDTPLIIDWLSEMGGGERFNLWQDKVSAEMSVAS